MEVNILTLNLLTYVTLPFLVMNRNRKLTKLIQVLRSRGLVGGTKRGSNILHVESKTDLFRFQNCVSELWKHSTHY